MKIRNLWAGLLALGVVLAFSQFTRPCEGKPRARRPALSRTNRRVRPRREDNKSQKRSVRVTYRRASRERRLLDDQDKAKQFEGKSVKVTGTLEAARSLIHVSNIELA